MGAHMLKEKLTPEQLVTFETAVRYQMYHSFGLILVGLAARDGSNGLLATAGWLFVVGLLLFSGGIYGWLFTAIKPLVHIVPVGGSLWIVAWICFAFGCWKSGK
jgi:uncharacterized membrane protein YgdD (TMEM256/DUF423 family)